MPKKKTKSVSIANRKSTTSTFNYPIIMIFLNAQYPAMWTTTAVRKLTANGRKASSEISAFAILDTKVTATNAPN